MPRPSLSREGKRQRFYARNARKTTLELSTVLPVLPVIGRSMRSFWATPYYPTDIHPALNNFAEECCAVLARLLAYLGTLALVILVGIHLWGQLPTGGAGEAAKPGWSQALRSHPAFAVSQSDFPEKTEAYEIFRHPLGGRRDVMRWAGQGERPIAELEIYRPGGEFGQHPMHLGGGGKVETAREVMRDEHARPALERACHA